MRFKPICFEAHLGLACLLVASLARAQAPSVEASSLSPPQPLVETVIAYPSDAPPHEAPVEVEVRLLVDTQGHVARVELVRSAGSAFDQAVLLGATHFRFVPAQLGNEAVAVEIAFTQRFEPPLIERKPDEVLVAMLAGVVEERGSRKAVADAVVAVESVNPEAPEMTANTDKEGAFAIKVPEGELKVYVMAPEYKSFQVTEQARAGEALNVRYLLERLSYSPYETIVVGRRERTEISRTRLAGREIKQIPGTFGDPFRVISTLPGVGSIFSLLGYPIVRGTSPGNTGFLLDGVAVPQLFHMMAGPAVVHPEFIDQVDFYPGNAPVAYGGYIGGIVNGITRPARDEETRIDLDVDLVKSGLFLRGPVPLIPGTFTLAGRYGYPAALLSLFSSDVYASYWDYQARYDLERGAHRFTTFALGSSDEAGVEEEGTRTSVRSYFHRVDLRYQHGNARNHEAVDVILGVESSSSTEENAKLRQWSVTPRGRLQRQLLPAVRLRSGVEGSVEFMRGHTAEDVGELTLRSDLLIGGVFLDLIWKPVPSFLLIPGVRGDVYRSSDTTEWGVDPRLLWRWRMASLANGDAWLKGGVGYYHQPPRFFVPIPGFENIALQQGLLASLQSSLGAEVPLGGGFHLDGQVYFHYMDPIVLDLAVNEPDPQGVDRYEPKPADDAGMNGPDGGDDLADLFRKRIGRAYGIEVLLRREDTGPLFGWLSYTLSRSERLYKGRWVTFDFDRTHMLHLVAGIRLPRSWHIGLRAQVQSGRPVSTEQGYNRGRTSPFFRIDLRIDKTAVWNNWLLDFYVDIINVTLAAERLEQARESGARYVLPTLGFRLVL